MLKCQEKRSVRKEHRQKECLTGMGACVNINGSNILLDTLAAADITDMDKDTRMSILYDYYGQLLTEQQRRIFSLYHDDNLSLSEIGFELRISKQGIHDALKKSEHILEDCESKLGLIENNRKSEVLLGNIQDIIRKLLADTTVNKQIKDQLEKIKKNINELST